MPLMLIFFFFNDTATTEIYTLSLHDALPISPEDSTFQMCWRGLPSIRLAAAGALASDRKSTRLNSSHQIISYAVFCLKKKMLYLQYRGHPQPPTLQPSLARHSRHLVELPARP